MIDNFKNILKNHYVDFEGRARRKEFWMFKLAEFLAMMAMYFVVMVIVLLGVLIMPKDGGGDVSPFAFMGLGLLYLLVLVVALALFLPDLAVTVRRLHDTGKSGWWILLAFIPLGGLVIFIFTVVDGDVGDNQFGPDPKAGERIYYNQVP